jgi:hypothetical protein
VSDRNVPVNTSGDYFTFIDFAWGKYMVPLIAVFYNGGIFDPVNTDL